MKQIYNFETANPPVLNENILRMKLEKRKVRQQTILLGVAGILFQIALLMFGVITIETYPAILLISLCYAVISAAGSGAIAVIYAQKGGKIYE